MLLSSCCLASSATQDGSQHCDYLCIFKHGTLCFLKGLMYSRVAGWLPSPHPFLQGPHGCQLHTSQAFFKAGLASGCITHPPASPNPCKFPKLWVMSRSDGRTHPATGRATLMPLSPSAGLLWKPYRELVAPVFTKGEPFSQALDTKADACLCGCTPANVHASTHAGIWEKLLGVWLTRVLCFYQPSTKAAESDHLCLRLCNFYEGMFVHTPVSISYVGSLHMQSCTHKGKTWKGLQGHRWKKCIEVCWQISACLSIPVHAVCSFTNPAVTPL